MQRRVGPHEGQVTATTLVLAISIGMPSTEWIGPGRYRAWTASLPWPRSSRRQAGKRRRVPCGCHHPGAYHRQERAASRQGRLISHVGPRLQESAKPGQHAPPLTAAGSLRPIDRVTSSAFTKIPSGARAAFRVDLPEPSAPQSRWPVPRPRWRLRGFNGTAPEPWAQPHRADGPRIPFRSLEQRRDSRPKCAKAANGPRPDLPRPVAHGRGHGSPSPWPSTSRGGPWRPRRPYSCRDTSGRPRARR